MAGMSASSPRAVMGLATEPRTSHQLILFVLIAAGLAIAPLFMNPVFLMKFMCFAIFAVGFNLLFGYAGMISFGHAAFFGMASYISAYSAKSLGLTPELAIGAGVLVATVMGVMMAALSIRRRGIYFAMVTLALAQLVFYVAVKLPFTGGEDGMQAIPRGMLFGVISLASDINMYFVVFTIFCLSFLLAYRIVTSPFGQVLEAIRENEDRAISLGYEVDRHKLLIFTLSAFLTGVAGATKAIVFQLATMTDISWTTSGEVLLMALIGGVGTLFGPLLGAAILISMQAYLATIGTWVMVVQGTVFVVCVTLFPSGIVGLINSRLKRKF